MESNQSDVPKSLRFWFVVHFCVDMIFAIPLLFYPEKPMVLLGWSAIDPIMPRLVGAALLGIGLESFLGRKSSREVYNRMLSLKIIWSSGAIIAIGLGIAAGGPQSAWLFLGIFVAFWGVWIHYRLLLSRR